MKSFTGAKNKSESQTKQESKSPLGEDTLSLSAFVIGVFLTGFLLRNVGAALYYEGIIRDVHATVFGILVDLVKFGVILWAILPLTQVERYFVDYEARLIAKIPEDVRSPFREIAAALNAIRGIDYKNAELEKLRAEREEEQNAFFANVSHELRTPLTTIQGCLDLLAEGDLGPVPEDQMHYVYSMQTAMERLMPMVNNIIDLSKAENGRMEVEFVPFVARDEAEFLAAQFEAQMIKKHQHFDVELQEDLPEILGDPYRFRQVMVNLLGNAVKYTPDGGAIVLRVFTTPEDPQSVSFSISDTGVGISPEGLEHLGEKFYQVRVRDAAKGSGLGIAIVKELLMLMHGDLQVWSQVGVGSTFTVRMPIQVYADAHR